MPTTFIAVQCFQCSIMQVKQQKKSSNKWSCVVCNQKQSVRKVFAQGSMARDVRKFVQNFNMSRQLSDQKQLLDDEELEASESPRDERKKKRNDWTEYVDDDQEEYCGKFDENEVLSQEGDGFEPRIVTEMPKALFKKPKVKDYSSNGYETEKLFKPLFPNRSTNRSNNAKRHHKDQFQETQLAEFEQSSYEGASKRCDYSMASNPPDRSTKWNQFKAQIQDNNSKSTKMKEPFLRKPATKWNEYITQDDENDAIEAPTVPSHRAKAAKGQVSKWSSFISEEDDGKLESRGRRDSWDCVNQRSNDPLESLMNDERVEDDIHPDFL